MLAPVVDVSLHVCTGLWGVNDFVGIYVDRLVSEVVKASASKAQNRGSILLEPGFFRVESYQ